MPRQRSSDPAEAVTTSLSFIALLFAVRFTETLFNLPLTRFGIVPRTVSGLWGILWSPLLHVNVTHLMANALPLFVLLVLLLSQATYAPYRTLALIWGLSGLGTWLIGRSHSIHIGASSLVFGLAAFLIVAGLMVKSWRSAAVAVFVFVAFGGIFYGVLPRAGPISWEAHLCGVVAGALTAARTRSAR
jgi:membrane associated rhomboid family serine protease